MFLSEKFGTKYSQEVFPFQQNEEEKNTFDCFGEACDWNP